MHFHLPKPLHGWREFAGEVGIIVLGVLIALGAEQLVEAIHWRSEVAEFRHALDKEVALDLAYYDYRLAQRPCVHRRIADLERWQALQRSGQSFAVAREIGRPSILTFGASVWKSRGSGLSGHMPIDVQLAYADIYDNLDSINTQLVEERDAWRSLAAFNGANRLSADNLMRLGELIYRVKSLDWAIDANDVNFALDAAKIGVKGDYGVYKKYIPAPNPEFCKPLLPNGVK